MPLIEARALTKRYGMHVTALDSLTLDVEPGIIGLVGANGAGKSTLLKILLGLLEPTSGSASVMGLDVTRQGPEIRQFVGYLPEHDCLPPDLSATDFVTHMGRMSGLPASASRERTAEVLRHVGLYEERYRPIGGYSTGMKQRVKLAQALVHDPKLLLLDEPTNGLDPAGRDEMLDLVKRTGTEFGIATVVASHLLGEIERVCSFLLAIDDGRLLRAAPIASFTERTGTLGVEVEEGADALAARLDAAGLDARVEGRTVLVDAPDERPYDLVRDTIAELGLALVRLEHRRHRLEDLFRGDGSEVPNLESESIAPAAEATLMTSQEPALRSRESATGAIYDLGYRGYDGPRLGRRYAVATLFWASLRAAYALKRSGRAKIVPWGLAALLLAPAGVSVAIAALAPGAPVPYTYDNYLWDTQILLAIFVAAQAPELVSSDQRHHVLSLYFSHALERTDYALAKLAALAAAVFGLALAPMLVLFLGSVLLAQDVAEAFGTEIENLPQVILAPLLYAIPLSGLSLAIAAYTPRRAYATGAIIAVFIVTAAVSAILGEAVTNGPIGDVAQLINPFVPIDGTRELLVGGPAPDSPVSATGFPLYWFAIEWVLLSVATAGIVLWRYRRVSA